MTPPSPHDQQGSSGQPVNGPLAHAAGGGEQAHPGSVVQIAANWQELIGRSPGTLKMILPQIRGLPFQASMTTPPNRGKTRSSSRQAPTMLWR